MKLRDLTPGLLDGWLRPIMQVGLAVIHAETEFDFPDWAGMTPCQPGNW